MSKASIKLNLFFGKDEDNDDYVQVEGEVLNHEGLQDNYERAFLVNFMRTLNRIMDPMIKGVHEKNGKVFFNKRRTKSFQKITLIKGDKLCEMYLLKN